MSILLLNNSRTSALYGDQPEIILQPLAGYSEQYFISTDEIAGSWTQDGDEWFAEMQTPWDDIVSTMHTPGKTAIMPVKLYEQTQISFEVKTTFGPKHSDIYLSSAVEAGGVFGFYVSDASKSSYLGADDSISNLTYIAGWNDWQTISFTLQPGEYFLYFDCIHIFLVSNPRWTDRITQTFTEPNWGHVPDGETATYEARVRNFQFSPGIKPYQTSITAGAVGGSFIDPVEIPVANISILPSEPPGDVGALFTVGSGKYISLDTSGISIFSNEIDLKSSKVIPVANVSISPKNLAYIWELPLVKQFQAQTIYTCTLSMDSYDDLEIPMSSFSARSRTAEPSYLSVVIPNIVDYEDDINAMGDGEISIQKGFLEIDGTRNLSTIITVNFDYLRVDHGTKKASGSLVGYRQTTYDSGAEKTVGNISYRSTTTAGKKRLRGDVDLFIKPGDICIYDSESFVIDTISYFVSPHLAYMEVAE